MYIIVIKNEFYLCIYFTILILIYSISYLTGGTDFTPALSQELSFTALQKQNPCFTFTALQDAAAEDIEFFNVVLTNPNGITIGTPSQTSITINDDNDGKLLCIYIYICGNIYDNVFYLNIINSNKVVNSIF